MRKKLLLFCCLWAILVVAVQAQSRFKTVNYLNSIKGKQILSGQHNDQKNLDCGASGSTGPRYWTDQVFNITGKYPALYGGDFLFHGSSQLRWDMTYEAERQWNAGAMVNIMWHACPPTQNASCGWDGGLLSSITAQQFAELLTNGSALNNTWKARVNEIAVHLQYLEDKGVEVLWRPYHEQNQTAFWWNSQGVNNTKALWRMMHNYMTNDLGLTNLVWVLDVQDIGGRTNFWDYNPGNQYWDIMALDIYADGLTNPEYYNNMLTAAGSDKLVALGECFNLPNAQAIDRFSQYGFFMNWAYGLKKWYAPDCRATNSDAFIREVYNNPKVITRDEMPGWGNVTAPPNLATAKPITVSSTEAGGNGAANAVDGSYTTRWSSLYTDAQWLSVDLGANYNINRVKITWEAAYGKDYTVQYSANGSSWTTAKNITGNTALVNDHTGLTGTARYVRINGTARGTVYGYSIYELEVYGTPATVNQAPTVSIAAPTNNASYTAPANINITANASDSDGLISKVDFYNGATLLTNDYTAPFEFSWTNVSAGTYTITARATDNSGAGTTSSAITVVVTNPVTPPSSAAKVVAYVANWNDLNSYSNAIDYAKLTHINIAFENPNANGDLSFNAGDAALIQKAHANNVKVYVSIGGGSASTDPTIQGNYFSLISDARRAGFVAKIAAYLQARNFDGIDVDLEGPAINGDYGKFIADLSATLKPAGKGLTAALSQGYGGGNVPSSTFAHFDFINIMAYDATGPWDTSNPGQHSSYAYAQSNLQYWLGRGLPKSKAVLGLPFYGYGFGAASGEWSYKNVVSTYAGSENVDQAGNTIWYNGIPTIKAKVNYAFDQAIGGVMIWELSQDATGAKSLLLAIDQVVKSRGSVTPVPANLATGKPVSVSSTEAGLNAAGNAVDGQYATRWSSAYTDAEWLTVDLGATYSVNRVKLTWEAAYGKDYRITGSVDGITWFTLKTITGNNSLVNDHVALTGNCRYISMNGTARGTVFGYSIYEMEVYGTPVTIVNQAPTVSLTSPVSNATVTAPASLVISANASDSDGSISKVDFYSGSTLLFSDNTSPFGYTWTNVPAGTYAITARATDNSGAVATSSAWTITVVNVVNNSCASIAQFVENGNYVAGSKVKNNGRQYECKPFPYSGWCNGAAWAYGPGTGAYWSDAWTDKGSCTARTSYLEMTGETTDELYLSPNPSADFITLHQTASSFVSVWNTQGLEVISRSLVLPEGTIDISTLSNGIYFVKIETGSEVLSKVVMKK